MNVRVGEVEDGAGRRLLRPSHLGPTDASGQDAGQRRWAAWLAGLLCLVCLALASLAVVFAIKNHRSPQDDLVGLSAPVTLILGFSLVGVVIAVRRPRHRLGWLFLIIALSEGLVTFANEYVVYALWTAPGSVPAGAFAAWLTTWIWAGGFPSTAELPAVALSHRATAIAALATNRLAGLGADRAAVRPDRLAVLAAARPHLVRPGDWTGPPLEGALAVLSPMVGLLMGLAGLACVLALVFRFRRARGVERQQLKWFMFAATLTFAVFWVADQLGARGVQLGLVFALMALVAPALPIAIGIALVRYRLYDIDRLINRTVVYGLLTAILGLCYAAGSLLFVLVAGAETDPPSWLVAAATLAAAAFFRPVRRRIQQVVDRRFNRRRYHAAQTIEAFSARLREQVDLDTLSAELVAVTDRTMEPTLLSLCLRPPTERSRHSTS